MRSAIPGPLAGVPYGVKDLFDVAGYAHHRWLGDLRRRPPRRHRRRSDPAVASAAGAVLVATLNMDEFAYGFATINARHGTTAQPA